MLHSLLVIIYAMQPESIYGPCLQMFKRRFSLSEKSKMFICNQSLSFFPFIHFADASLLISAFYVCVVICWVGDGRGIAFLIGLFSLKIKVLIHNIKLFWKYSFKSIVAESSFITKYPIPFSTYSQKYTPYHRFVGFAE